MTCGLVPIDISLSLTPELAGLVRRCLRSKVASGRYTSTSEVVRGAWHLPERTDRREAARKQGLPARYSSTRR